MDFKEIILSGGVLMAVLLLISVAGLAAAVKSILVLRREKYFVLRLYDDIKERLTKGDFQEARSICIENRCFLSNVLVKGIDSAEKPFMIVKELMETAGIEETMALKKEILPLNTIGVIAPMIGLLGTVIGMMESFQVIAFQEGMGNPPLLAAGISKALVTTAAGLSIGIPAMGFFLYMNTKIVQFSTRVQSICSDMILLLMRQV